MTCYICSNPVTAKTSQELEYDGFDRVICEKCIAEHPSLFDSLNNADNSTTCPNCGHSFESEADRIQRENEARVSSPAYRKTERRVLRDERNIRKAAR